MHSLRIWGCAQNHLRIFQRTYKEAIIKGSIIIHGLEGVTVYNKSEVYKILGNGSEKHQSADIHMNAQKCKQNADNDTDYVVISLSMLEPSANCLGTY